MAVISEMIFASRQCTVLLLPMALVLFSCNVLLGTIARARKIRIREMALASPCDVWICLIEPHVFDAHPTLIDGFTSYFQPSAAFASMFIWAF